VRDCLRSLLPQQPVSACADVRRIHLGKHRDSMGSDQIGFVSLDGECVQPYRLKDVEGAVLVEYHEGQYMLQSLGEENENRKT
jgi:hypothetical protein